MSPLKTHKLNKSPRISARYLADYMAATETRRRAIVRDAKYQRIARVVQHNEAKLSIGRFLRSEKKLQDQLLGDAKELRNRMADTDFDRDVYDHNAEYIERFAKIHSRVNIPKAEIIAAGSVPPLVVGGVKVTIELACRLRRQTRTNKIRTGAIMLRYAKGEPLPPVTADWQSAFLFGYLVRTSAEDAVEAEHKLCITLDAYSGKCYCAPGNSVQRFNNMEAACEAIAERWNNIQPPPNAVL